MRDFTELAVCVAPAVCVALCLPVRDAVRHGFADRHPNRHDRADAHCFLYADWDAVVLPLAVQLALSDADHNCEPVHNAFADCHHGPHPHEHAVTIRDADANAEPVGDAHPGSHAYAHTDPDDLGDSLRLFHPDADGHVRTHADSDPIPDRHSVAKRDAVGEPVGVCIPNGHDRPDAHRYTQSNGDTCNRSAATRCKLKC